MSQELNKVLQEKVSQVSELIKKKVSETTSQLEDFKIRDADELRLRQFIEVIEAKQKRRWKNNRHGEYTEVMDEGELHRIFRKSNFVILHLYRKDNPRCEILDRHLDTLAKKHLKARFCKILADKATFYIESPGVQVIPTIALIRSEKLVDYIVGFTDMGDRDDFKTEVLEWRLAISDMIDYNGNLSYPPIDEEHASIDKKKEEEDTQSGHEEEDITGRD